MILWGEEREGGREAGAGCWELFVCGLADDREELRKEIPGDYKPEEQDKCGTRIARRGVLPNKSGPFSTGLDI